MTKLKDLLGQLGLAAPIGLTPDSPVVGMDELGNPIYQGQLGHRYSIGAQPVERRQPVESLKTILDEQGRSIHHRVEDGPNNARATADIVKAILAPLANPGRAARGESMTLGDVLETAGDWGVLSAPASVPKGALRSGIARSVDDLPPAKSQAREVLDLLRQGRAEEVTDEMIAAADDAYLYQNYDLPMDESSRMARAREMGFDTETPLYHGTTAGDFSAFKPSNRGRIGPGVYLTPNVRLSDVFAGAAPTNVAVGDPPLNRSRVIPVLTTNNPADEIARSRASSMRREAGLSTDEGRLAFQRGLGEFDGVRVADEQTILDPSNIRSRFARFDPRLKHLANLSAGAAGVTLGDLLSFDQEKQSIRDYLGGL